MEVIEIRHKRRFLQVCWALNNVCNYNCSYCTPINKNGQFNNLTIDTAKKFVDVIFEYYAEELRHNIINFNFTGGEPTIWKYFVELCEYIKSYEEDDLLIPITVNTNFSRPLKWWEKHVHLFDMVIASFQIEFANKDEFFKKTKIGLDTALAIRLSMHKDRFWEVSEFGEKLVNTPGNYRVEWVPLFDELGINSEPFEYKDKKQKKFLNEHTTSVYKADFRFRKKPRWLMRTILIDENNDEHDFITNDLVLMKKNYFLNWECNLGLDSLFVSYEGDVEGATCRLRYIGNIIYEDYEFPNSPMICTKEYCHCGADIMIPKRKVWG